jgi:hypothetical protein
MDAECAQHSGADDPRRCYGTLDRRYEEDEENDPDWLAEDAVVLWLKVPLTLAFVPEAELLKEKEADPAPPLTASISAWVSSIMISITSLPYTKHTLSTADGKADCQPNAIANGNSRSLPSSAVTSRATAVSGCDLGVFRRQSIESQSAILVPHFLNHAPDITGIIP